MASLRMMVDTSEFDRALARIRQNLAALVFFAAVDAQRLADLNERDRIREWLRADRTRDGERVLPLP